MKEVILLRGLPGSGKSTIAQSLTSIYGKNTYHVEADTYFYDHDGNYNFEPSLLEDAHKDCMSRFRAILRDNVFAKHCTVIVSNTSTRLWEFNDYRNLAETAGFRVHILIVENWDNRVNTHDVSDSALETMEKRFEICLRGHIKYPRDFNSTEPLAPQKRKARTPRTSPMPDDMLMPPNDEGMCPNCGVVWEHGVCLCDAKDF